MHATTLEQEVGYLTQIHELMAMVEPQAVSERVTRLGPQSPRPAARRAASSRSASRALRRQLQHDSELARHRRVPSRRASRSLQQALGNATSSPPIASKA
jgi:hypothetical protein